ncbi:molecular chaperone TorD family protein [Seleniivibrio sp.]|uniref:TorD/DmsD family molecular chaperone n=1 Tax=Seleniivibrio sp. TaxID=2898801 RepID=UPI0025D8D21F|nr:molecular chaperone TorD family protein [Seleniivibrio sp.]MCD8554760.1 molecular chaperone TorD family protein [Seleniivibrio sp.]
MNTTENKAFADSEKYLEAMAAFSFFNKILLDAPEREYINTVKENAALFDEWCFSDSEESKTGLELLKNYLKNYKDEDFTELLGNFNRLFIGPGHLFAPPWESVYKEQDKTIFGEATLKVRGRYRKFGLEINNLNREPDDHIAFECAYLNYLCAASAAAEDSTVEKEEIISFLKEHPSTWVEEFTDNMIENSVTDFYKGIAQMLRGAIKEALTGLSCR